jgi:hypothetical protein
MKFPEQFRHMRVKSRYESHPGDRFGSFIVPAHKAPGRRQLFVIACDGAESGWDHVSVSVYNCKVQQPTWEEMCFIKGLFWNDDECVVQFHPAKADYINIHPGVLHLWKAVVQQFPMPPKICV